jgi:hypothetical protein
MDVQGEVFVENGLHTEAEWDALEREKIRRKKQALSLKKMDYKEYKKRLAVREWKHNFMQNTESVKNAFEKIAGNKYLNELSNNSQVFVDGDKNKVLEKNTPKLCKNDKTTYVSKTLKNGSEDLVCPKCGRHRVISKDGKEKILNEGKAN